MPPSHQLRQTYCVAVATSNGVQIDVHLGQASHFNFYEVTHAGSYKQLSHCTLPPGVHTNPQGLSVWSPLFEGVDVIIAARVGPEMQALLQRRGILTVAVSGPIDRTLTAIGRRGWILFGGPQQPLPNPPSSCDCGGGNHSCKKN